MFIPLLQVLSAPRTLVSPLACTARVRDLILTLHLRGAGVESGASILLGSWGVFTWFLFFSSPLNERVWRCEALVAELMFTMV